MVKFTETNIINETSSNLKYYDYNKTRSNLPFQIALYLNLWLFPIWLIISIINLDAKYNNLSNIYKLIAVTIFLILSIFESLKLYLGYAGNLIGKIPELTSCWLISILIQLPLEMYLLFDYWILFHYSEILVNSFMVCLLFIEIITGMIALKNLANHHAKVFYLMHLYGIRTNDG
ncbi:transmembrane protein 17B [Apis mellifera carnica]|uniref:Transmembrane protein 17B n=1 Tax=Apis mellifera TaxID=7460 RepID=A0A7M7GK37_APIME|nr:transmembrane protein 17B [Apis mellifera]KAG9428793.1 transmembrane protein 17B [Apis mellifera carnica]|eukprot:XP_006557880.1 transmembrane protein 17B [Apis mellifera]